MIFYTTKYRELILTVDPKTVVVESGVRMTRGMHGLFPNGLSIEFKNRMFDTKDLRLPFDKEMKLIKVLKNHPSYGVSFVAQDSTADEPELADNKRRHDNARQEAVEIASNTDHDEPVNKKK